VLLAELAEVLRRPHLAEPLAAIGQPLAQVIADYVAAVELVVPTDVPRVSRDPDDDQILACALTAQANLIVSGDDDLLSLDDYEGIPILPAAQALKRIQVGS